MRVVLDPTKIFNSVQNPFLDCSSCSMVVVQLIGVLMFWVCWAYVIRGQIKLWNFDAEIVSYGRRDGRTGFWKWKWCVFIGMIVSM